MQIYVNFEFDVEDIKALIGMQLIPKEKLMEAIRKSTVGGPEPIKAVYDEPKPAPKKI